MLYYDTVRRGFVDVEVNKGMNVNMQSILIVKDKGLLFAEQVYKELALSE